MKKLMALILAVVMCVLIAACGGPIVPQYSNASEHMTIDAICVDDSYQDGDNSSLRMVYLFYTLYAGEKNLRIDSKYTSMTIEGTNSYDSDFYPDLCKSITNYYYSSYIEDVYMGSSLKVAALFEVPEAELAAGRTITFSDSQIPGIDQIRIKTDDIKHFNGDTAICKEIDPQGYAEDMVKREDADAATVKNVKSKLNGYYWEFFVNSSAYELEFIAPNKFELRVGLGGSWISNTGTYTVQKGYIFCTYPSNNTTVEIPYEMENGELKLHCTDAFDVHS